jgi:hypothetical protein
MNKRILAAVAGAGLAATLLSTATASTALAGDGSTEPVATQDVYHNDRNYTKAEAQALDAAKQAQARGRGGQGGVTTQATAMGCYDWYQLATKGVPALSWTQRDIGWLTLYYNSCYGGRNRARVDHINSSYGIRMTTIAAVCAGSRGCIVDSGNFAYYADTLDRGDLSNMNGVCVSAAGIMYPSGVERRADLGPGWCG